MSIREFVTINRGTGTGSGITRIGNDNWLLAYTHVAHDCIVGNHCVFSNNSTLAGHVEVGDWVIISGFAGVHQFCRIGAHAFLGMGVLISGDVPPYTMVATEASRPAARHQQRRPEAPRFRRRAHRRDQARLPHAVRRRPAAGRSQAATGRAGARQR